jgi:hypothetical protein
LTVDRREFVAGNADFFLRFFYVFFQTAAVLCIQNLIWREDEGSMDRQAKLKDIG